ncbi:unnamed protein product [Arctogadus glacialis]
MKLSKGEIQNISQLAAAIKSTAKMQTWMLMCWVVPALVWAEDCPAADGCVEGHTCCSSPGNGFACCPFEQVH